MCLCDFCVFLCQYAEIDFSILTQEICFDFLKNISFSLRDRHLGITPKDISD